MARKASVYRHGGAPEQEQDEQPIRKNRKAKLTASGVEVAEDTGIPITDDNPGGLPEAGADRRAVLKRRLETLQAEAEELSTELEVESIDESKLMRPEREILQKMETNADTGVTDVPIDNPDPSKAYCWVQCMYPAAGASAYGFRKKLEGWKAVTPADKYNGRPVMHSADALQADGTYRIGDVFLMQIDRERYDKLKEGNLKRLESMETGIDARVTELAQKFGIPIHRNMDDPVIQALFKQSVANEIALKQLQEQIRGGTVPALRPGE